MQVVIQQEATGCGIASVATLAGVSYSQARDEASRLGIFAEDKSLWSDTIYVRKLLKSYKLRAAPSESDFRTWEELPNRALLATKWHLENGRSFWHWVVFYREQGEPVVLDPRKDLRRNKRKDFGRIKPKWYIEIYDT